MKLSNPTDGILTASMTAVLEVMNRIPTARSGRSIASSCQGVSVSQANIVLRRLESIGIVSSIAAPPSKLYSLNSEHLLTQPLLDLVNARERAFGWLSHELASLPGLISATYFGSVARGEDHELSDLDLLLVFEDHQIPSADLVFELGQGFLVRTGNSLGVISKSLSELSPMVTGKSAFMQNVLSEGVVLLGEALATTIERNPVETPSRTISSSSASISRRR